MTDYEMQVINGLAEISTKQSDLINMIAVLSLIVASFFVYVIVHNSTRR